MENHFTAVVKMMLILLSMMRKARRKLVWLVSLGNLLVVQVALCDSLIVHSNIYDGIPRLTRAAADAQWDGRELFQHTYSSTMAYHVNIYGEVFPILFVSDPGWHRIIYGDKNHEWIKSWGRDGPLEQRLHAPTDICSINDYEVPVGAIARLYLIDHPFMEKDRNFD